MDLSESTFFDSRSLDFLNQLLSFREDISPINASEKFLIERREKIKELNIAMNYSLVKVLNEHKNYIPVMIGVRFLADCKSKDKLNEGVLVLEGATRNERVMNFQALKESIKNMGKLPSNLAASIYGESRIGRHDEEKQILGNQAPALNLDALRDFK